MLMDDSQLIPKGKDGKTKFAIENASKTRVVLADQKIHILGGFKNIHIAREAIVSLILGSPPVRPSYPICVIHSRSLTIMVSRAKFMATSER